MLGIGAMLYHLSDGSQHDSSEFVGRTVLEAELRDDKLRLTLDGGQKIAIWDDGQSCCEQRYIRTDDPMSNIIGHKIISISAKPGPEVMGEYEDHEIVFVEVATDGGFVTLAAHNEHNGYYSGFELTITSEPEAPANA